MKPPVVIGVIPARYASTRLPGKSLVQIAGKPLIQRVIERARMACRLDRLLVATDDTRIAEAAAAAGAEAVMTRSDHPSGTDRVAEAASGLAPDIVINIQGDEPLLDPALVDRMVEIMLTSDRWDMATAASPVRDPPELANPSVVKVVWDSEGRALYFSRAPIPFVRDGAPFHSGLHWRHIGVYAYHAAFLKRLVRAPPTALEQAEKLEQLRALHLGARIAVAQTDEAGIGVDTLDDVARVEALIRAREERSAAR